MTSTPTPQQVLATPMGDNDSGASSVGGYLVAVLDVMWDCRENFNPFGNSGWEHDLYAALVKAGHIQGMVDSEGYVETSDREAGSELIAAAIASLTETSPAGDDSSSGTEAAELRAQLAAIRTGADATPREAGSEYTPGQLWHRLLTSSPGDRATQLNVIRTWMRESAACFQGDHVGLIQELIKNLRAVSAPFPVGTRVRIGKHLGTVHPSQQRVTVLIDGAEIAEVPVELVHLATEPEPANQQTASAPGTEGA
ncbi:hypothetical protein [Umezawaea tangerina]|uniref:Uncharacterized protein n=1 Tax=Umezawaea tangerina TaxID=84725 RepID=A0A2T0SPE7_9PSEU|nr:hypothetical protein [Umezawaea tangerina]PRY35289.1 hypothetical protein CLV43_114207 [Umezawaea tangerina]